MTESDWIKLAVETSVALIGLVSGFIIAMAHWVANSFEKLVNSISLLNTNVALVVAEVKAISVKTESNEQRIERLERKGD